MGNSEEFVSQVDQVLRKCIGQIVGESVLKYNLLKFNKNTSSLSAEDCKILLQNIKRGVSLFITKDEAKKLETELEKLFSELIT